MNRAFGTLVIVEGGRGPAEIPLFEEEYVLGRPSKSREKSPDVDFSPDNRVSRLHARLFRADDAWWIVDEGSRHGTRVGDDEIGGRSGPTRLGPGVPVRMGDTVWMLLPQGFVSRRRGFARIEFRRIPAVNFASYHCGMPVLSELTVWNDGPDVMPRKKISISLPGYSDSWQRPLGPLPPGGKTVFPEVRPFLHAEKLEGQEGRRIGRIEIRLDGEQVFSEEIPILGFYEWSLAPAFRRSLACFVQPSHPVVGNIVLDAADPLAGRDAGVSSAFFPSRAPRDGPVRVMREIYNCLKDRYRIRYALEAPSFERDSQVIRPPHRVIADARRRRGEGTCIDLALLFASCLESVRHQPLVIFVRRRSDSWHALCGCWTEASERFEPVLEDRGRLAEAVAQGKLLLVETTGFASRSGGKISFVAAMKLAGEGIHADPFLFALDVSAARQTVVPLHFPFGPGAIAILRKAESLARREGSTRLETRHLLMGFLSGSSDGNDFVEKSLVSAGADVIRLRRSARGSRSDGLTKGGCAPRPTMNYRRLMEDARITAADAGQGFVEAAHLYYALLLSRSESVDRIIEGAGTDRQRLRNALEGLFPWTRELMMSEF